MFGIFVYAPGFRCYNVHTDYMIEGVFFGMELTTIREIFKNREDYLDKKVTVGGWLRSIRDSKTFRSCTMIKWIILQRSQN